MAMTHKQRIMAAARKQSVDKLPFGARIDLWYNYHSSNGTLPEKYKGWSMVDINRDLGAGTQFRARKHWKEEFRDVEVVVHEEFPFTIRRYRTPVGTISYKTTFNPYSSYKGVVGATRVEPLFQGVPGVTKVEPLFKGEKDYPTIEYLIEHTTLMLDLSECRELTALGGEDAAVVVDLGPSPMQTIMRDIMGYETFFYELYDHPRKVERLHEGLKEQWRRKLEAVVDLPIELPVLCSNWSDDIHTPVFKKYFVPWLQEATEFLHAHGKLAVVHIDGEMKRLIPFFLETGIDVAEAWTPAPMTAVTTADLRKAWGDRVTIWGGVPAILFEPTFSDEEFDAYIINLFREIASGNNFIVGMGDNLPFDGKIERVRRIVELIDKYGTLPIEL